MMMVAQEEIKPVELELMAISFIQFSFSVCACDWKKNKKKTKKTKKSIGFKKSERTGDTRFSKKILCVVLFVCLFFHFLGLVFYLLFRVFPQLTVV